MIRNKANGKVYVGSAVKLNKRWDNHKSDLRKNKHHSKHLQSAWNKYGQESFDFVLLEECIPEVLIMREQNWIDFFKSYDDRFGYNIAAIVGNNFLGRKHTEEAKEKNRQAHLGWRPSEEQRKKQSQYMKENRCGEDNPMYGKKCSLEHKQKIREGIKRQFENLSREEQEEKRRKMIERSTGENNPCAVLSEQIVKEMRAKYQKNVYGFYKLSKEYGVSKQLVVQVILRKTWRNVE